MKITWLGQAGLLLKTEEALIMIDPYLSNSVEKAEPKNIRRVPIKETLFELSPDVMIFTHDHLDHYDPETAPRFLQRTEKKMTVLAPLSVWKKARTNGGPHNYILFDRGTEWTEYGLRFRAVRAVHSDPYAIGVLIESLSDKRVYYITGDTLYSRDILEELPKEIDLLFLPINGVGNNMNAADAVRFSRASHAKATVPYHVGMFDSLTPEAFTGEGRITLSVYQETEV